MVKYFITSQSQQLKYMYTYQVSQLTRSTINYEHTRVFHCFSCTKSSQGWAVKLLKYLKRVLVRQEKHSSESGSTSIKHFMKSTTLLNLMTLVKNFKLDIFVFLWINTTTVSAGKVQWYTSVLLVHNFVTEWNFVSVVTNYTYRLHVHVLRFIIHKTLAFFAEHLCRLSRHLFDSLICTSILIR